MSIADRLFKQKEELAASNLKAGQDFLAANKEKQGITTLPSGLQYEILTEGTGAKPGPTSKVTCHYHGTLIDGTVFDSSVQRGQPATFPLNMVIKGWTEGLQLMPAGSKWRFFIPADLGYGNRQVSAQIGPNSTLIFDVELISIS
jgi:FKBP-type peptidyl-prolyl cis-trans isomerase FklB